MKQNTYGVGYHEIKTPPGFSWDEKPPADSDFKSEKEKQRLERKGRKNEKIRAKREAALHAEYDKIDEDLKKGIRKDHVGSGSARVTERNTAQKRRRKKPIASSGNVRNAVLAAMGGSAATLAVDRTARAIEAGITKAAEKTWHRKKAENSWEEAAKKVK